MTVGSGGRGRYGNFEWSVGGGRGQGNLIRRYVGRPADHFCMQPVVGRRRLFLNCDAARYFGHTPRAADDVGRSANLRIMKLTTVISILVETSVRCALHVMLILIILSIHSQKSFRKISCLV